MTDLTGPESTGELFAGLDRPRSLPPALRERLEEQLLATGSTPESVPLGAALDERLRTTLTDPLAAALAGIDDPRPLPPALRDALAGQLLRRHRQAQRFLGAAAAVVLAVALAVVLTQPGPGRHHPARPPAAAPAPTALPGDSGVAGVTAGGTTVGGAPGSTGAGSTLATSGKQPAPAPAAGGAPADGTGALAAAPDVAAGGASPDAGPLGGGTTVTVRGRGLSSVTGVWFGRRPSSSYAVVSDSTVRAVTPAVDAPATVDVVLQLKSGASYRLASAFSYLPRPAVSSLSPQTGASAGGTWVSVTGSALSRTISVSFGGSDATRVEVVSDSQVRALSPQHLAGPVDVTVTTPGGTSATTTGDRFTYLP